ncbi:hypothetical protein BD414DRAFT_119515 [Trametes punicea]|nr:hypothetical protein BD414DRAFT_119515 [Trametes punicea]
MTSTGRSGSPVESSAHTGRSYRLSSVPQDSDSTRRHSKLPDLLTRKRTSSMPHKNEKDGTPVPLHVLSLCLSSCAICDRVPAA